MQNTTESVNGHLPERTNGQKSGVTFLDRWLVRQLLNRLGQPPLRVMLWNGEGFGDPDESAPRVHITRRGVLFNLLTNPSLGFGDGYSDGEIQVNGGLIELLAAVEKAKNRKELSRKPPAPPAQKDLKTSRRNIHRHYDISNAFYQLWLDEHMVYTCAYFENSGMSLEEAQTAKMDHVCRKLRLQPGQEVIEAGCGWGGLALHMAAHYGVKVRAFNISTEQIAFAREQARHAGLESRVEFVEEDWRNLKGKCDAFVSVGMLEHVGVENYCLLGDVVRRSLNPKGLGLIHTIGRNVARPLDAWNRENIFPGAHPPSLREMMDIFEQGHFSILDLENLRLHYALTLEQWLARFDENEPRVCEMFDERFVRMWRLYLSASVAAFRMGAMQLFQVVFAHGTNNEIPMTRHHIYAHRTAFPKGDPTRTNGEPVSQPNPAPH